MVTTVCRNPISSVSPASSLTEGCRGYDDGCANYINDGKHLSFRFTEIRTEFEITNQKATFMAPSTISIYPHPSIPLRTS